MMLPFTYLTGAPFVQLGLSPMVRSYSRIKTYWNVTNFRILGCCWDPIRFLSYIFDTSSDCLFKHPLVHFTNGSIAVEFNSMLALSKLLSLAILRLLLLDRRSFRQRFFIILKGNEQRTHSYKK